MRVTNSMMLSSTLGDLNRSLERLQKAQTTLSTGRVINTMSDDPAGASASMAIRSRLRQMEQHDRSMTDAQGWLNTADSALMSGLDLMSRVKAVGVQAGSTGLSNPTTRAAIATEIRSLREGLLSIANTEYMDKGVFSGTSTDRAYDAGGTYQGDQGAVRREIATGVQIQVNLTGTAVFGEPGNDVFAKLDELAQAVEANDSARIAAAQQDLDGARELMLAAAAEIGVRGNRIETAQNRLANDDLVAREALSDLEDADIAEALINVKASENAYTASLQAAAKVIPPSLVDFLR